MKQTFLDTDPLAREIMLLVDADLDFKEILTLGEGASEMITKLLKSRYIQRTEDGSLCITNRAIDFLYGGKESKKGIKATPRVNFSKGDLKPRVHPRQSDIDAMRAIPSVFNGVRYVAK